MKIASAVIILLILIYFGNGQVSVSFLDPDCGVSISGSSTMSARIVQGQVADMFANPWMALISSSTMCGGSLITNRFVLSAAHCRSNSYTVVYLGEFDRSTITDCSTTACMPNAIGIPVDAQIAHPRYVHHSQNDIALFRLATPVQYSAYIKPICLLTNYNPLAHIRLLTAIGWGTTEHGVPSNVLKTTTLTQVDRSHCSATYGSVVDMSHICAGDRTSHTCMGDSGGPIFATLPIGSTSRVVQMGIVSYGDSECRRWGVYTNVMHHMNWILQVVRQGGPQVPQRPLPPQGSYYVYVPWYAVG
ncbi:melanization protease 1-like [Drosophila gunungcola]|uniref:melanization protease 1-like n=1 Tax=Drosophila gunungcola TaxID=103775 RepID=UPI0022E82A32|nr:melanization protease 1-like [Drosophila gunungcola]